MRMKILIGMCCMVLLIFVVGCVAIMGGGGTAPTGFVYTGVTAPMDVRLGDYPDYKVIGQAEGKSKALGVLGIAAAGDAGIGKAYQDALRHARGDALIDVQVDQKLTSVLGLFYLHTTIVKGTAVKFVSKD